MPFQKGQSGNPKGAPKKEESLTKIMKEFLNRPVPDDKDKRTYKELFTQKTYQLAMKGDIAATRLIWNYIEGMPQASMDVTSDGKAIKGNNIIFSDFSDETESK